MWRDYQTYACVSLVYLTLITAIGMRFIALDLLHSTYMFGTNLHQLKYFKKQHISVLNGNNNQTAYLSVALKCLH